MSCKAVFFDLDGTLMDTSEGIFLNAVETMQALGVPIPEGSDLRKFVGPPLRECFRITFGVQDEDLLDRLKDQYKSTYEPKGRYYNACFYPGIIDTLKELKRRGYKTAITSMKGDDLVKTMARHFSVESLFDGLYGFEEINGKKTKKDIVLHACKELGIKPSECTLVGDTVVDEIGARDAGASFIKVNWGFGFEPGEPGSISKAEEILDRV